MQFKQYGVLQENKRKQVIKRLPAYLDPQMTNATSGIQKGNQCHPPVPPVTQHTNGGLQNIRFTRENKTKQRNKHSSKFKQTNYLCLGGTHTVKNNEHKQVSTPTPPSPVSFLYTDESKDVEASEWTTYSK